MVEDLVHKIIKKYKFQENDFKTRISLSDYASTDWKRVIANKINRERYTLAHTLVRDFQCELLKILDEVTNEIPVQTDDIYPSVLKQYGNKRLYKQAMRERVKAIQKAFETNQSGCFYAAGYYYLNAAKELINKAEEVQKVKNWSR
jgi:hypothetical protein